MMRSIRKKEGGGFKGFFAFQTREIVIGACIYFWTHPRRTPNRLRPPIDQGGRGQKNLVTRTSFSLFYSSFSYYLCGKVSVVAKPEVLRNKQLQWVWEEGTLSPRVMDRGDFFHLQWWPRQRSIKLKKEAIKNKNQEQKGNRGALSPLGPQSNDGFGINGKKCLNLVSEQGEMMDRVRLVGFQQISTQGTQRDPVSIAVRKKGVPNKGLKNPKRWERRDLDNFSGSNFKPCIR